MDKGAKAARLADHLRDYLAAWIQKDFPGCLVSVSQVQLSTNLKQAIVWLEIFNQDKDVLMRKIEKRQPEYQHQLYHLLQRFSVPSIQFRLSTAQEDQERIEKLLNSEDI